MTQTVEQKLENEHERSLKNNKKYPQNNTRFTNDELSEINAWVREHNISKSKFIKSAVHEKMHPTASGLVDSTEHQLLLKLIQIFIEVDPDTDKLTEDEITLITKLAGEL